MELPFPTEAGEGENATNALRPGVEVALGESRMNASAPGGEDADGQEKDAKAQESSDEDAVVAEACLLPRRPIANALAARRLAAVVGHDTDCCISLSDVHFL